MPGAAREDATASLALLVESVTDYAIFMLDPQGHVRTWNRGAERIKGYTFDEIVGRHFSTFYTEPDRARDHPSYELEVAERVGRFEEEGWRVRKDGGHFWANVVITAVRDADGTLVGFGKVTRDLTARREAEEELAQFRRMISSVRDYAIFMLDPSGTIATWNEGARHLKGYEAEDVIGRHFSLFYTDADRARDHPARELEIATETGRYEEEGWRVRKDGSQMWASVTITAVRDEDGELRGFAKITRDLTERRAAEEEVRRTNAELERFAAVAAHDLREPLTTVGALVQLLIETESERLTEQGRGYLETAAGAVTSMQHLIEDLFTYARLGSTAAELVPVALEPVVRRALDRLDASVVARGAEVTVDVPAEAEVKVDRMGADVLVQNLLSNAIKFGQPDGPTVEVRAEAEGSGWRLRISDDGRGVSAEDQARIFEPFERVRSAAATSGQGLGLSICRRVIDRSGGRMGVDSAPGEGSSFWAWLPSAP